MIICLTKETIIVEKELFKELLKTQDIVDLETIYWTVLREKMNEMTAKEDEAQLEALHEQLTKSLTDEQNALLEDFLALQAKLKDQESYHNFRLGIRYGIKYFIDILS